MVEERQRLRHDATLSKAERARLDRFLKITANSTSYGILARFDRRDLARNSVLTVYGPDEDPTTAKTRHPEDPGPFAFPPIAASLTAAARLMLALLERFVTDARGTYAFCDTDSMGIVTAPRIRRVPCHTEDGTTVLALSRNEVRQILARFEDLNPYDRSLVPALWKQEYDSLDRPVTCYAISAKRYALVRDGELLDVIDVPDEVDSYQEPSTGIDREVLVDRSEHGLGLYLDPSNPEEPQRDEQGRRVWITRSWEWILGRRADLPEWSQELALTRFTVSTARVSEWFRRYNNEQPAKSRVRPGSFGLLAHPSPMFRVFSGEALPAAPYDRNPRHWGDLAWYDRRSGQRLSVGVPADLRPEDWADLDAGLVLVDSLADVVTRYRLRPEHKSIGPDGSRADGETTGLVRRRPVLSAPVLTDLMGKEGNRVLERLTGEVTDTAEYRNRYGLRADRWEILIAPVLREMGSTEIARATGKSRSAIERAIRNVDPTTPYPSTKATYLSAASNWTAKRVDISGGNPLGVLYRYRRDRWPD
jgi:hypothetical protein